MRETVEIMRYPVTLTPAPEGGYMVSFVDIPEALTQGETVAEAMEAAKGKKKVAGCLRRRYRLSY